MNEQTQFSNQQFQLFRVLAGPRVAGGPPEAGGRHTANLTLNFRASPYAATHDLVLGRGETARAPAAGLGTERGVLAGREARRTLALALPGAPASLALPLCAARI
eukprot:396964-Rhodomonas_salina.4